ncbi:MAG TPA: hypothetical protein VJX73_12475 [Terracidiphilus sp.]|nr:hypothetical protein [Terracidiphilus sp.]
MMQYSANGRLREDLEERQRATVWPDTLRAGRSVDEFLWKGDPKATPIQSAGLLVFATFWLFLFAIAIVVVIKGVLERELATTIIGTAFGAVVGYVDFRLIRNAFRHKIRHAPSDGKRE